MSYAGSVQPVAQVNVVPKAPGRIQKIYVDVGSAVKQGDLIAELDHATLDAQVLQAQANVASAQSKLETVQAGARPDDVAAAQAAVAAAQARLNTASQGPSSADLAAANATVVAARSNLSAAQQKLADLQVLPKPESIRSAELAVQAARDTLNQLYIDRDGQCGSSRTPQYQCQIAKAKASAQEGVVATALNNLALAKQGPLPEDLKAAQDAITGAQSALDSAIAKVNYLASLPNPDDVAAAQSALDQAIAQANLKANPYTAQDLKAAQAGVQQAQAALQVAQSARDEANVVAPFDGVVSQKQLSEGAFTSTNTPIITLVANNIEVVANVEEANIGRLQVGLPVSLAVAAYQGQAIPGKVSSVSPTADPKSHNFTVKVAPDAQDGKLKGGMFANVNIVAEQRKGVVLVPKDAVVAKGNKQVLFVMVDGKAAMREVSAGLSDGDNVQVTDGVSPGDMIIVEGQGSLNDGDPVRTSGAPGGGGNQPASRGGPNGGGGQSAPQPGAKQSQPGAKPGGTTPTPAGQ
ncbi:MAG: efflux RND transporter periplasmic adaptor subunit [Bacteroidetes bacterium]|nr:efflux RND transporter periplasmic adaptor subunit [Bacteroidota bacterium]